jgi:SAM-dependent methyltransferase
MTERYTHGHFGTVVDNHASRTAADSAAFLLPHLEASDAVLDIGCGPGSISLDLAERAASLVGVDAAPEAVKRAEQDRRARGLTNASFRVADVYELPFRDGSFDVVFGHQLLQHLAEPVSALEEAKRVLVPGGLIAVRDADYGTMVHYPPEPALDRWLDLYHELARHSGGEPDAGRRLSGWVGRAGFVDIAATTSTWTYSTPEAIEGWRTLWTSRLLEARMGRDAVESGLATGAELAELAAGWNRWAAQPRPFFAFLHGEVLARKPG